MLSYIQTAGSAEQFKKVDYEYVASSAKVAKQAGVKMYSLISCEHVRSFSREMQRGGLHWVRLQGRVGVRSGRQYVGLLARHGWIHVMGPGPAGPRHAAPGQLPGQCTYMVPMGR
jgi:hypothetical protein